MTRTILITGATGFVGAKLLENLSDSEYRVRCLARDPDNLADTHNTRAEIIKGDVFDPESLTRALDGIDTAFYLIHSMKTGVEFADKDKLAAKNFADACVRSGIRRIIYLGGLGEETSNLSSHLKSRRETGEILRNSGVNVIEFRAAVILGKGSLSFKMMKNLVERLPAMVTPKWVSTSTQPIYIDDVIAYLTQAIELETNENRIYEIGGPDVTSYGGMMREYAKQKGLKRIIVPVPVLTPYLSGLWLKLVTPDEAIIGRSLIEGLSSETIVNDKSADRDFRVSKTPVSTAIRLVLAKE